MTDDALGAARLAVIAALQGSDAGLAYNIVLDLMGQGVPFSAILSDLLAPVQSETGSRWQVGDYSIPEEHASTAAAETLVATLAGAFDQPVDAPHVVVACAEGDSHTLPPRMASAVLMFEGFATTFLGSALPAAELGEYLSGERPDALVLSCTMASWLPGARACVRAAHDAGVPVLAGGRGYGDSGRHAVSVGADSWAPTLASIPQILRSWSPDIEAAEAGVGVEDIDAVVSSKATVVEGTYQNLAAALGADSSIGKPARLRGEIGYLFDTLVGSLFVDDPGILTEFARFQAEILRTQHITVTTADQLLASLHGSLEAGSPAARLVERSAALEGS